MIVPLGARGSTLIACCLLLLGARSSFAAPVLFDTLRFETSAQSLWGSGAAPGFDREYFLGTRWNTPTGEVGGIAGNKDTVIIPGIPEVTTKIYEPRVWIPTPTLSNPFKGRYSGCGCWKTVTLIPETDPVTGDTRTGGIATARTFGEVGFRVEVGSDSGSVDAALVYDAALTIPDSLLPGELFSLAASQALSTSSSFSTQSPTISGKAEALLGAQAELGGQVCFIGAGCSPDEDTATETVGFSTQTLELVSFNDVDSPGEIKVLGVLDPALFQFGSPIDVPLSTPGVNFGNVTVHVPDVATTGAVAGGALTAQGSSSLLDLKVDIDGLVLNAFGLPSALGASLNAGIFNVDYDLIDVEYGPLLELLQSFELTSTLMVDLEFSRPVRVEGLGEVTQLTSAWDALPRLALLDAFQVRVEPEFYVEALFENLTTLGLDGEIVLSVLAASFSLEAFGLSLDVGELGPLFELGDRDDFFDLPPLFSETFALGGFARVAGEPFVMQALEVSASVPEPDLRLLLWLFVISLGVRALGRSHRCATANRPRS